MAQPIHQVDAFTDTPFSGNPAAVCVTAGPRDETWMQRVATEMNLSETAFLHPEADGYRLRWFTPVAEVELCGHATLASAHVLWETGLLAPTQQARFHTLSGLLTADCTQAGIELDFPATSAIPADAPPGLLEALGVAPVFVGRSTFDVLVEVADEDAVRALRPDYAALAALDARGVMVTSLSSESGYDFVSRFFAPAVGVDEDPVTGSAHCCLGPYWGAKLVLTEMTAFQASERGGTVRVRLAGDRVRLGGKAVTVLTGELFA